MNNKIDSELPKLKSTSNSKQINQDKDILIEKMNKKSLIQSTIALILIIIAYIIAIASIIITKQIDSLIGWIAFFLIGIYPLIIIAILCLIGFILSAIAYKNNEKNKIVTLNLWLLCIPVIYIIINLFI
ncbi:MAG: hypothetical protein E7171_07905 [Firmicutes bacterium]|nr:hypothetical protein [Bacillota bacterium]